MAITDSNQYYNRFEGLDLLGRSVAYTLDDGSVIQTGRSSMEHFAPAIGSQVIGNTVRYFFSRPADGLAFSQDVRSSAGYRYGAKLSLVGQLVMEATVGSKTAVLRGQVQIVENEPELIQDVAALNFVYFTAAPGAIVPFEITYEHLTGTWQQNTLHGSFFSYRRTGSVDFSSAASQFPVLRMQIVGPSLVPSERAVQYALVVTYLNGAEQVLHAQADWSVTSDAGASVEAGLLRTGIVGGMEKELRVRVDYEVGGNSLSAEKTVRVAPIESLEDDRDAWSTAGGNRAHSGHVPIDLEPQDWQVRWSRFVGPGISGGAIAAADGRVFVSGGLSQRPSHLYSLDAADGTTIWEKGFGAVRGIDAPAAAYGNVYVQTNRDDARTIPEVLRAFDAETGDVVFESRAVTNGGRDFGPTLHDGFVYTSGRSGGGAIAFDAFSGSQIWSTDLPDKWDWTPAVDEQYVYVFVDGHRRVVRVLDRQTGELAFAVPSLLVDGNNGSIRIAPILGNANDLIVRDITSRLLSFDLVERELSWTFGSRVIYQPAVREDAIYVVNDGMLVVLDAESGTERWSWSPLAGSQAFDDVLVTDSHVFVVSSQGTSGTTHAIELASRKEVWTYPQSGQLAFAGETLYITSTTGDLLTAVSMPEYVPGLLTGLTIEAPDNILELSEVQLVARAMYSNGGSYDRSVGATWDIEVNDLASISPTGLLGIGELFEPEVTLKVSASYFEDGILVETSFDVVIKIAVSLDDFVLRNVDIAKAVRIELNDGFAEAERREHAAQTVLQKIRHQDRGTPGRSAAKHALEQLRKAIYLGKSARDFNRVSIKELNDTLDELAETSDPAPKKSQ